MARHLVQLSHPKAVAYYNEMVKGRVQAVAALVFGVVVRPKVGIMESRDQTEFWQVAATVQRLK